MKITITSPDGENSFGGPYEWIKRLGPALRKAGFEVNFILISTHSADRSATYQSLKSQEFNCSILSLQSRFQYNDNTEDRVKWILNEVKKNPPDIFVANLVPFAMYAGKWIKEAGIPVIGVIHSTDEKHEYIYQEFISGSPEFAFSGVVAVSSFLTEKVIRNNPYQLPVRTISCGTPLPDKKVQYQNNPFRIVYAGKITNISKRITDTTYALCKVASEIEGVEVYIYGKGPEEEAVKQIIAQEGKDAPIYYKGFVDSNDIQELVFLNSELFILLSDFEGLPIALMEAMACGVVPICSNLKSGIPELIEDGVTGLLVNDRGIEFFTAVKKIKEDPFLWQMLSKNAIDKIRTQYSIEATTQMWIDFFKEMKPVSASRSIEIPGKIILPPVNPLLKVTDRRKLSFWGYLSNQFKRISRFALKPLR